MNRRQRGIAWFAAHAGYTSSQGRMVCARDLFDAEEIANANEWEIVTRPDWDPDLGDHAYWCDRQGEHEHDIVVVVLISGEGRILTSISGVIDPDRDYLRVLRAQLALELL